MILYSKVTRIQKELRDDEGGSKLLTRPKEVAVGKIYSNYSQEEHEAITTLLLKTLILFPSSCIHAFLR